ncbi:MAG: PTS IIA-like nitrogen regulatory protein PtsN [Thiohalomonadaceae bacterium]
MQLSQLLELDRIICNYQAASKKRVLEQLSQLIANGETDLSQSQVFDSLLSRERLGSTGLGRGVAIPHARIKNSDRTIAALLKLESGVDYDAIDGQAVDLVFALLVPEQATDEHLQLLAQLAEMFSNSELVIRLRNASEPQQLLQAIQEWQHDHP